MKTYTGTYHKGRLTLDRPFNADKPMRVKVTFEEEAEKAIKLSDFSFAESQELLKDCKTSFSEEVVAERRKAV